MLGGLKTKSWWSWVHEDIRELLTQSALLADIFKDRTEDKNFHDYAFIVFPAAKAYEGFLKTLFLEMGFIDQEEYFGKRFRIGKALNPALEQEYRQKESVYDQLVNYCNGKELPDKLWDTWKNGRNVLFHWFPNEKNAITYESAKEILNQIISSIDLAFEGCKIEYKDN